jgi:hypothetical protein
MSKLLYDCYCRRVLEGISQTETPATVTARGLASCARFLSALARPCNQAAYCRQNVSGGCHTLEAVVRSGATRRRRSPRIAQRSTQPEASTTSPEAHRSAEAGTAEVRGAELVRWQAGDKPGFRFDCQRRKFLAERLPGLRYSGSCLIVGVTAPALWQGDNCPACGMAATKAFGSCNCPA